MAKVINSKTIRISIILIISYMFLIFPVHAQTVDITNPTTWQDWQTNSTGLQLSSALANQTAGLDFILKSESNGFRLKAQGGIQDGGHGRISGPPDIDLGMISIPQSSTMSIQTQEADWAHNTIDTLVDQGESLSVTISRLTPALLVHSNASSIQLLSGTVSSWDYAVTQVVSRPKYIAYLSGGTVQVHQLSSSSITLPPLDQSWLLVWYGTNSHFRETKVPTSYTAGFDYSIRNLPISYAYSADVPIIIKFEHAPTEISQPDSNGGIQLSFSADVGNLSVISLYGRNHLDTIDTEQWGSQGIQGVIVPNLQQAVSRVQQWSNYLCYFPESIEESYSYNESLDTAEITETVKTWKDLCQTQGTKIAFLPPMLGVINDQNLIQYRINGSTVSPMDLAYHTEFGPLIGFENTDSYTWEFPGISSYVHAKRIIKQGSVPNYLQTELESQIQQIISTGHLAPWFMIDGAPRQNSRGDIYWLNPADTLSLLLDSYEILPDTMKGDLRTYLKNEQNQYPAQTVAIVPWDQGAKRGEFNASYTRIHDAFVTDHPEEFNQQLPLYNFYALGNWYETLLEDEPTAPNLTNEISEAYMTSLPVLDRTVREQDWATMYWFQGFAEKRYPVETINRFTAGLTGFIKLAEQSGNTANASVGKVLLAKALAARLAFAHFPRYLESAGAISLPSDSAWQPKTTAIAWHGHVYNYSWQTAADDARQVALLNQFNIFLYEHTGFMYDKQAYQPLFQTSWTDVVNARLFSFTDMSTPLYKLFSMHEKTDLEILVSKFEQYSPNWYAAFAEGILGQEHNLSHPIDSYQTFMAKALLQKDTPENLELYADVPWLETGDLFYINKLAETIKAYRGWCWSLDGTTCDTGQVVTPSPTTPPAVTGDIDGNGHVDLIDLTTLLSSFGGSNSAADFDVSGTVDLLDLVTLLGNFGR